MSWRRLGVEEIMRGGDLWVKFTTLPGTEDKLRAGYCETRIVGTTAYGTTISTWSHANPNYAWEIWRFDLDITESTSITTDSSVMNITTEDYTEADRVLPTHTGHRILALYKLIQRLQARVYTLERGSTDERRLDPDL
jgi:hypothetical protein